jgi:thiol:disulfide interchange protein
MDACRGEFAEGVGDPQAESAPPPDRDGRPILARPIRRASGRVHRRMNAHAAFSFACRAVRLPLAAGCAREGPRTSEASPSPVSVEAHGTRFSSWTPETFARAEREKKPLLVHVAAVWCHWCRVMEEETY